MHREIDSGAVKATRSWVTILILARNEAHHISRCIRSALRLTERIYVVDSCSADGTAVLAEQEGAKVVVRSFSSFAEKLNWSLDNIRFDTPWIMRLDADEELTDDLIESLYLCVRELPEEISGVYLRRQLWFMGQWIVHGGMYPTLSMRLWKTGSVRCEERDLDEHMLLSGGRSVSLELDLIDNPIFDLTAWIEKHNQYASLEAKTALNGVPSTVVAIKPHLLGNKMERTRWIKLNIFYKLPLFVRPWLYFFYRYIIRLGILDGRRGFLFHFFHGLWYRILVDAKIYESRVSRIALGSKVD